MEEINNPKERHIDRVTSDRDDLMHSLVPPYKTKQHKIM
jgi:hypothetical protein